MAVKIITISREFGSGGRFIGEEVAKKLGMKYYDKDIIGQIAEQSGFSPDYIREHAELSPKKGLFAYAFILRERADVLNVFIHGDLPEKAERICRLYNVKEAEAVKMMADIDKRRMTNYNFYTDQKWGMAGNYTLSLNSSQLGYDKCQKLILGCVK